VIVERYEREGQTWSVSAEDRSLVIVDHGIERVETLASSFAAYQRFRELVSTKEREGWTAIEEPATPLVHDARNLALEAALLANPLDQAAWLVYGDWLHQQGDPRGEYIALRAAWHANPSDPFAPYRVNRFERRHGAYLRGRFKTSQLGMGGFADNLELTQWRAEDLTSADARFVTHVTISSGISDGLQNAITGRGPSLPVTVRTLNLLGHELTDLSPIVPTLERLHELMARTPIRASAFDDLATCALADLRRLSIEAAHDDRGVPRALLEHPLPSLTFLCLETFGLDAAAMTAIARAPYAPRLRSMMLFFLDDAATRVLIDNLDRFPAVEELTVDDSRMTPQVSHELWSSPWKRVLKYLRPSSAPD
jgi:uncharacterized protein (TIGR02996 family)